MNREWVEAGGKAVRDGMPMVTHIADSRPYRPEIGMYASWNEYDFAKAVIAAVEPLIRADVEKRVRAQIAADIEALPCIIMDCSELAMNHRHAVRTDDAARIARGTP